MKKITLLASVLLFIFILNACNDIPIENTSSNLSLSGDFPPNVNIKIDSKEHETKLGSYCWESNAKGKAECVDTAGPLELLEDVKTIKVNAGEQIKLIMDYTPKPNKIHLSQMKSNHDEMEIEVKDNQFTAPNEKGIYFYSYGFWWMDEEDKDLSHGDAFYAFSLEVK